MTDFIVILVNTTQTVVVAAPGPQGPGVPLGGTAGQALVKNSDTDFDTVWAAPGFNTVNAWTKQQYYALSTLSINGDYTIDWNWNTQPEATVTLPNGHSYTLNLPSNRQPGIKTLRVYQDSTGGATLSFNSSYIIDVSLSNITFHAYNFVDFYFKDDGTYITVFAAEYATY
jgi:hypothetical protein